MIRTLRGLDVKEKRQLIKLLAPGLDLDEAHEEHVTAMLKVALRGALEVPPADDLPEVMRRRLVEVAVTRFELARKVDLVADDELAKEIIGFLLIAAHRMANDDALRAEFVTFLRTKDRPQRSALAPPVTAFRRIVRRRFELTRRFSRARARSSKRPLRTKKRRERCSRP